MSGLLSRTAVLTVSRVSNFAIHLFSPLLLVRILDVPTFGQYQEFMIYAGLLTVLCAFAVDSSLTYFLPRFPERERSFISQTTVITLVMSSICLTLLIVAKPLFLKLVTIDLVAPLAAYVFFFVNINWVEYYWIAKRQPRVVLYYSAVRLIVRISVLLVVAYASRDVLTIAWSLVGVEAVRIVLVLAYFVRKRIFVSDIRRSDVVEQLGFAGPIGAAALLQNASRSIGKMFISSTLGPAALAFYASGSYLQPVVRVARSGIEDAVYPELVRAHHTPGGALRLWQRVNVLNCVMFFPAFVLLSFYADLIVTTLFTTAYQPAVPIFTVYAFFLLRRCFSTDVLLRTTGRTGFMLWGTIGALIVNIVLMVLLSRVMGMIGPAIAFIAAEFALELYYAQQARRALRLSITDLADWGSIAKVTAACVLALPVLIGFNLLDGPKLVLMAAASSVYFVLVLILAYHFGVSDVGRVVSYVWSRIRPRSSR
jgi:O-antigen/teichoic acid export membrane protein